MGKRNRSRTGDLIFEMNADFIHSLAADSFGNRQPYRERLLSRAVRMAWEHSLTPRQKTAMDCYYRRNMNITEIAAQQSVTPSAVSRLLCRARKRLRTILQYYLIQ